MPRVHIPASLRRFVIERAQGCCEYCLLPDADAEYPHEIDHVIAVKHGGKTVGDNLALACLKCNRNKGSDVSAIDPIDELLVPLFNPRRFGLSILAWWDLCLLGKVGAAEPQSTSFG